MLLYLTFSLSKKELFIINNVIVAVPKEIMDGETRVALIPAVAADLIKNGLEVRIESGAGEKAFFTDEAFKEAGAKVTDDKKKLFGEADIILKINKPSEEEVRLMKAGAVLICLLWALQNKELVELLAEKKVTALGMEALPRISRAQKMDVLSSMSSIAGYKSVLIGANSLGKYLPMLMTAAGTIAPSKILVLGAGVAGLQAIATAKRLGAVVEAFDVRPAVKEQVESLGASFVEVPLEETETETSGGYAKELSEKAKQKQREVIHERVSKSDIVITTALIPGKPAPELITAQMVEDMRQGSVIVDLASEQGGNCALTQPDKTINHNGVTIHGPLNLAASLPIHASQLYAKNVTAVLLHLLKDGELVFDFEDEITKNTTITHDGKKM
ncbi:MAG: Re/Si-specific NAD(P)(+) transhydrogenase subunit alpha [Balneolales bacterium]